MSSKNTFCFRLTVGPACFLTTLAAAALAGAAAAGAGAGAAGAGAAAGLAAGAAGAAGFAAAGAGATPVTSTCDELVNVYGEKNLVTKFYVKSVAKGLAS